MSILNSRMLACSEPTRFSPPRHVGFRTCVYSPNTRALCLCTRRARDAPQRTAEHRASLVPARSYRCQCRDRKKSARKPLTEGKAPVRELAPQAARGGPSSTAATNTHTKQKASAGKGKASAAKAAAPKAAKGKAAAQATAPKAIKSKAAAPAAVPVKKVIAKKRRSQGGITAADREDAMAALMSRNFHAQCAGLAELFS